MNIAILGYGKQGAAALEYWSKQPGSQITVCDKNEGIGVPEGNLTKLGNDYLSGLGSFDLIVRSPSIHPKDIVDANDSTILDKVTTVTNEFFKVCPSKNIIGVTGTKGKGTTSTLITKSLEAAGKKVHLGGNIGTPPLDMLKEDIKPEDWVVLELANFQLIDIKYSPPMAVCLMVVPEHLDWHTDTAEYYESKKQLFIHQNTDDVAIYFADNQVSTEIAGVSPGKKIPYFKEPGAFVENGSIVIDQKEICKTDEIKLLGKHNWQNVCAAVTCVWQITQDINAIRSVLTSFSGLEHRLELVRELEGIKYYDDSFATTPEAATVAIEAFPNPKVVILGGSDKGADYRVLAETVKANNVRKVVLIGDTAPAIQRALNDSSFTDTVEGGKTMPEIVNVARSNAQPGDVVLLSTGCASFGLFKDYKDRGEQFSRAVQSLA